MTVTLRFFSLALILAGVVLFFELPAYAYADPGTGLLAVQAVGSALVAGGWYLRRKIYSLFHRVQEPRPQPQEMPDVKGREDSPLL